LTSQTITRSPGQVPAEEAGRHLATVWVTCPAGHVAATQKASGTEMMCSRCSQELSADTVLTVPERTPETTRKPGRHDPAPVRPQITQPRSAPRAAPAVPWDRQTGPAADPGRAGRPPAAEPPPRPTSGTERSPVRCAGCHGVADVPPGSGYDRPRGWLSLSVRVPPEASPYGKPYVFVGQWCGVECLAGSIPGLARSEASARQTYAADRAIPAPGEMARVMAESPRGR